MKFARALILLGLAVFIFTVMGCTASLMKQLEVAAKATPIEGGNPKDRIVGAAVKVNGGPMGQSGLALGIYLEKGEPQIASEKTTTVTGSAASPAAPKCEPPIRSLRGKKALLCSPAAPPETKPVQVTVNESTYFNKVTPLANTGGTTEGWLVGWGKALINAGGRAAQGFLMPGTNIKVGGAKASASATQSQAQSQAQSQSQAQGQSQAQAQ